MKFFNAGIIKPKFNTNDILECKNSISVSRYVNRKVEDVININFVDKYRMFTIKYLDWKKKHKKTN